MTRLIVVIGITGTQGSSVANTFLNLPDWKIRGITRDPSKSSAQDWTRKGVEIVQGDLNDNDSLRRAFIGANVIFAVTDFWAGVSNPTFHATAQSLGKPINAYCYEAEIAQGRNIADAAAEPEVLQSLERFVFSSLSNVTKWSKGKYTHVYHFDSKAKVVEYIKENLPELDKITSTVQIGEYADNWKKYPMLAPKKQPDGSFILTKPTRGDAPIPMVVTNKDTGIFVKALISAPGGTHLLGYGSLIGWEQYVQAWGQILNVKASFKQVPADGYVTDMPEVLAQEISEGYAYQGEFGWDGGDPSIKHPKDLGIEGETTSIEDYIRSEDWSSVLNEHADK